jgi:hypothetical protein
MNMLGAPKYTVNNRQQASNIPNTGKTLPIANPSMKELEGCILVMVGV